MTGWSHDERRWRVQLEGGQGIFVRPANMVMAPSVREAKRCVQFGPPPPAA